MTRRNARQEVDSISTAIDWLIDQARHGQSIQRYKGLGEMNPDQLWETTLDPAARTLLQVRIREADEADDESEMLG